MNKKIIITSSFLAIAIFFSLKSWPAAGQVDSESDTEIRSLNDRIQLQKQQLDSVKQRQQNYQDLIKQKQEEKSSLSNELDILNNGLESIALDIEASQLEIDKTNLEIKEANIDINDKDQLIEKEKGHIANLLKMLYKQDQVSTLEILLLNNSLADFISQARYLENTNKEVSNSLDALQKARTELEASRALLVEKEDKLVQLNKELEKKKAALEAQQQDKSFILGETQQSERRYQALLADAKREQEDASNEIYNLEKKVREKLAKSKDKKLVSSGFIWPVTKNYITTTFHDPDYPFRRQIGEHPGWDIKAAQGSPIMAIGDGYVARVKFDGSRNYAYIMIVYADGMSSVFGHVSAVNVKADDYVSQGQVVGRSGGMPGSVGSGGFTTGPHLHFEIRKDGIPVDPAGYLQ